jgi:hypothetical protein
MKHTLSKRISALAVSIFIITAPMAQGTGSIGLRENPGRTEIMPATIVRQKPMMLAENEENTAGEKAQTATGTKDTESEAQSGPETDNKEQPNEPKTAPLKPFRPSEEIAAEQAVDFPVDI